MHLPHKNKQNGKKVGAFTKGFTPKQLPIKAFRTGEGGESDFTKQKNTTENISIMQYGVCNYPQIQPCDKKKLSFQEY